MYKNKNIKLSIILLALIVLSVILMTRGSRKQRLAVDKMYFSVEDTASIDRVEIRAEASENLLTRSMDQWQVNGKYMVDPSMKTVLLTVLNKVRAQRPVPANKIMEVSEELSENGIRVNIYSGNELIQSYISGGNGVSISYFMKDNDDPYIVHLPGYDSYVSGIFEVSENDWRDRFIFSTNWIGLKELKLEYPDVSAHNFTIETADIHLTIPGISQLDTTAMMEYIELFRYFQVDQFISQGDNPMYDSIFKTNPYALLSIDDTGFENPIIIKFFQMDKEDPIMPCLIGDQPAILSSTRMNPIFKKRSDFEKK
ncbi:hypothetical protein ACFLU5_13965 [Bacteroidota bacterium]